MNKEIHKNQLTNIEYLFEEHQAENLIVLFHGYGASMYDLHGLYQFIDNHKEFDWIFPNGPMPLLMGMGMSRAWFPIDVQELELAMQQGRHRSYQEKYTEEFVEALDLCEKFINDISKKYKKIIIGGFSQGAMISTHLTLTKNIDVTGLICFSGAPIGKKQLMENESKNKQLPIFQSHGKQDPILSYDESKELFELFKLEGHRAEFVSFDGVHEIPMTVLKKWNMFIQKLSS